MLSQRLENMQQALTKHLRNLRLDLSKHSKFQDKYKTLETFLANVDAILSGNDPNRSAEEEVLRQRLGELQHLTSKFSHNQPDLDSINLIGYRLPLNDDDSTRLKQLNQRWYTLSADTSERYKTMQSHLLIQQDFQQKCEEWLTFLSQVEQDLAKDISGDYDTLLQQQRSYDTFDSEIYSRQQILHAILSEGHQMIQNGDVEDKVQFRQKLDMLETQWQGVLRQTRQRKSVIDNNVRQWQAYRDNLEHLQDRLQHIQAGLSSLDMAPAPLQQIKIMHNNIKVSLQPCTPSWL